MKTAPCTIDRFVRDLDLLGEKRFTLPNVLEFLREHPVDFDSLRPYLHWDAGHYSRNLIHKTPLYELLALCWDKGQRAAIHNHSGQLCWMAVPMGRLHVQNFRLVKHDPAKRFAELAPTEKYEMGPGSPLAVEPGEPIHDVANLPEYGERAVSLHIYSRPFESCLVYDFEKKSYFEKKLSYTTVNGKKVG